MSDLQLDTSTGDIAFSNGDIALCVEDNEIPQLLLRRLRFHYGEWFLDESEGVPYFESIFVKNPDPVTVDGVLKRAIIETRGIIELNAFNLDFDNTLRKFILTFEARSIAGRINFSEAIP